MEAGKPAAAAVMNSASEPDELCPVALEELDMRFQSQCR